jgi:iron complex outermembrane receptor protein
MRNSLFAATALGALVAAGQASAQAAKPVDGAAATAEVGEIIVVARKRDERLRDVPGAASVIDAQAIAARGGVTDPEKLLAGMPGVRYVNTSSPTTAETSVRASGTSRGTFAESAIGLYRNGVYIGGGLLGGRNYARIDLFDLQRAEVVRGTQSALYGRNAVGGAINLISQAPNSAATGYLSAKYGVNNEHGEVNLVVNAPLTDKVFIRFGGQYYGQNSGFFYNQSRDEYFDRESGNALRGQIRYVGDRLDANLLIENQVASLPALNWQTVILPGPAFPKGFVESKRTYHWNSPSLAKQQINAVVGTLSYHFDKMDLVSTTALRNRLTKNAFDGDATDPKTLAAIRATGGGLTVDVNTAQNSQDQVKTKYQDIHLVGTKQNGFDWLLGVELLDMRDVYDQANTRTPTLSSPTPGTRQPARQHVESQAAYGTLSYDLTPELNLGAELRYANDKKQFYTERFDLLTGNSAGSRFKISDTLKTSNLSYNLIGSWRPTTEWMIYAKTGTAYRTGGFNRDLGDPRAPNRVTPGFGDEDSKTFEVGAKGKIARGIYSEFAAYRTKTDNMLVQLDNGCGLNVPTCPVAATSFIVNAGEGESWGIELLVDSRFNIGGGAAHISASGSRQSGEVKAGKFKGASFPQVPDWVASTTLNYRHPFIRNTNLSTNLAYRAQWGGIQEISGTPRLSDYQTFDARVALDVQNWQLAAFANNADNNIYVNFASATVKRWSQPRLYGLQLQYRW